MLLVLFGCGPAALDFGGDAPRPGAGDGADGLETLPDAPASEDTGPVLPDDPAALFSLDVLHQAALTLDADARASLGTDPYAWVPAGLVFDGVPVGVVAVRLKGRIGSFRALDGKAGFKLDLDAFGETDFYGLERVNLNNMVQDCAKVHDLVAYGVHRAMGTPAPRVGYAELTVDGAPYGLYALVEEIDRDFLEANFASPDGNLYDGDYVLGADGSVTLVDFARSAQALFQLDAGTDVALADVRAVTDAVSAGIGPLGEVVDLSQHAAFVATTAWTGHADSYSYYSNNYRVYFDPAREGRAVFLPWDPDWAFGPMDPWAVYGTITAACLGDAGCLEDVRAAVDVLSATIPGSSVEADMAAAIALIEPALDRDPRLETARRDIVACQADLSSWLYRRGDELAAAGL